ncbi:uncharacterized protein SPPG_01150 [Spizellomyces punctatus DAOM BR117]|uniref:Arrestin C-terminal-like domain-containing protein n=1 Tax=Spizellomyces punctatus (strain DAOM BR117) TaxID=645134 RepID=A0A0L0HRI5_SPIPD|nr:hypothetical protein, variant [Spizellomyces punctatus DAOM BR117]XP_016611722.1 uncharacterized protein SPPG_01150 [Spizellomyces punctatus DAOM BR117]KND03682.1 hypothetical protein, variant [Spizellomyces punctatus DAOM BR117]KND03683.1 hypothetical protein SPPG_01150 [Spizellomyces punctatus DAOM BR117]|eukprot:XP_016611721.1 hypothetical protein, variant [Spizellomyces punctatus DAOM BR117]
MAFVGNIASLTHGQRELHHKISTSSFGNLSDGSYGTSPPKASPGAHSALKPTSNMAFNPVPTTPGKCSKLKVNVLLDSTIYVAGGNLHGRMEIISSTNKSLKLGEISVELNGFEEVSDKDYERSQAFLSARIVFQGERMPPSNAVRGPGENGFWQANKGKTTFPFAFRLPNDAPSSYAYQNISSLRYVVTGVVQYKQNGRSDSLFRSKEAFVVENWKANHMDITDEPIRAKNHRKVWFGGAGEVQLEGTIQKSFFCSGNDVYVELRVKNDSKRRVQGIKLSLIRKLMMLREGTSAQDPLNDVKMFSESVSETTFKEKDFIFDPGEERANILNIHIPRFVRTVRNTALAEVACRVIIALNMGTFNKDLVIELPINVCHSASILPPPTVNMMANLHPQHYNVISDDPAEEVAPTVRKRDKNWKATLRARSASPPRTVRGAMALSPPKGRRALPWSDDEGDVADFVARRRARKSNAAMDTPPPEDHSPPAGGFLRELVPNSPASATMRGIATKGNIAKSPPIGPTGPISYVPAVERSKYLSRSSMLLDIPSSPNQQTETPTSPQQWATHGNSPDPLSLPSPVLHGRRALPEPSFYEPPPSQNAAPSSPTGRTPRPLPSIPDLAAARNFTDDDKIPIQYRTMSPPLKPRPVNYVSKLGRDPKPLPEPKQQQTTTSANHLAPAAEARPSARFSATSQLSTIVGTENNFLDIDFDFGDGFLGDADPKTSTLSRTLRRGQQMAAVPVESNDNLAKKENLHPGLSLSPPSKPIPIGSKSNKEVATISPRTMSPKLAEYLAKYSQAANGI